MQTTSNIDILYVVGEHFLSQVWRDQLHQNKAPFSSDPPKKFVVLSLKRVATTRHFCCEQRVPLWRWGLSELLGPKIGSRSGRRMAFHNCSTVASHVLCTAANNNDSTSEELRSPISAPSEDDFGWCIWLLGGRSMVIIKWSWGVKERERKWVRKRKSPREWEKRREGVVDEGEPSSEGWPEETEVVVGGEEIGKLS